MKDPITFEDFAKLEIRIGQVKAATIPEGSKKLIRQEVDFGEEIGTRIIFSGILQWYKPEDLVGKLLPYVINLAPRKMMGEESQGMLMAAAPNVTVAESDSSEESAVLLLPLTQVPPGTLVR